MICLGVPHGAPLKLTKHNVLKNENGLEKQEHASFFFTQDAFTNSARSCNLQ